MPIGGLGGVEQSRKRLEIRGGSIDRTILRRSRGHFYDNITSIPLVNHFVSSIFSFIGFFKMCSSIFSFGVI